MKERPNIVVCGYPRSGSTLFYNMLRTTVRDYNFTNREVSAYTALREESWPLITKFPSDCFYVDEILEIDPDAQFIVTIRDPRSVLCSRHKTTGKEYKVSWDRTVFGRPHLTGIQKRNRDRYQNASPGRFRSKWGLVDWDAAIDSVPSPYFVRYEQLTTALPQVQARLGKRFGLEYSGCFSDFHRHDIPEKLAYQMNGIRPVDTSRRKSWKEHPERIKEQFAACPDLHRIMKKRGYESDDEWLKKL